MKTLEEQALFAIKHGHTALLKGLVSKGYDFSSNDSIVFRKACSSKKRTVIMYLLKETNTDPTALNNQGFINAIKAKAISVLIIKQLLEDKRIDPSDQDNEALKYVASSRSVHPNILKLLLEDKRVINKIKSIKDYDKRIHKKLQEILLPKKIRDF